MTNAWWGSFSSGPYELAAHLLAPIDGRDWLLAITTLSVRRLILALYDSNIGFHTILSYRDVPPTGFPYGEAVDQTDLMQ